MARCASDLIAWLSLLKECGVTRMDVRRTQAWLEENCIGRPLPETSAEAKIARASLIGSLRLEWNREP